MIDEKKVYAFSQALKHMLKQLFSEGKEKAAESVIEAVDDYIAQFTKRAGREPSDLCRQIYRDIDTIIADAHYEGVQCRKGCAHCCRINVDATQSEVAHLVSIVKQSQMPLDMELLRRQQGRDESTWLDLPYEDRRCVFLDVATNECRVYQDRPLNCRKYMVMNDPSNCDTRDKTNRPLVRFDTTAEVVSTAWMTAEPTGSLAEGIYKGVSNQ